jgi:hypothetical protein
VVLGLALVPLAYGICSSAQAVGSAKSEVGKPATIPTTQITLDNWREIQANLDDVYNDPGVKKARGEIISKAVRLEEEGDKSEIPIVRQARRAVARETLFNGLNDFQTAAGNDASPDQVSVAQLEMEFKCKLYQRVVDEGVPLLPTLIVRPLKAQTYYFLYNSYGMLGDSANMKLYLDQF